MILLFLPLKMCQYRKGVRDCSLNCKKKQPISRKVQWKQAMPITKIEFVVIEKCEKKTEVFCWDKTLRPILSKYCII